MLHVKEIGISSAHLGLKLACTFTFFFLAGGGGWGGGGGEGLSRYYDVAQKSCSKFCSPKQSHDAIPHNIDSVPSQTQNSQSWDLVRLMNAKALGIVQRHR